MAACDTVPMSGAVSTRIWPRVVWTLVAVAAMFHLGRMTLPGLNRVELAHIVSRGTHLSWGAMSMMSVIALGSDR